MVIVLVEEGKALTDKCGESTVKSGEEEKEGGGVDDAEDKYLLEGLKCCKTPLNVAALLGFEDIVRYLVSKGANPNVVGEKGYNTLHFAVMGKRVDIA